MEKLTAKEAREKLDNLYKAMEGACIFYRSGKGYSIFRIPSEQERETVLNFINMFFEFNEEGEITGLCEPTIELYKIIGLQKGER